MILWCRVDTTEFKDALVEAYDNLAKAVLTALRRRLRQSNDALIEKYQTAEVEVNKTAGTGDEILALKRLIQAHQTQQDLMKAEIKQNKATVDFLVNHMMPIPQEVCCLPRCSLAVRSTQCSCACTRTHFTCCQGTAAL